MPGRGGISVSSTDRSANLLPVDYGYKAWTFPPFQCQSATAMATGGTVYVQKLWIPPGTVTNLHMWFSAGGSVLTSGRNFAGLFNSSRQLLSATADQTTAWASTDQQTMALSAAQESVGAFYYVGYFFNGTTGPTAGRGANIATTLQNVNLGAANYASGIADTGRTTSFPSTLTTLSPHATSHWVAVS